MNLQYPVVGDETEPQLRGTFASVGGSREVAEILLSGRRLHKLATNAVKYGALSVAEGHVRVEWTSRLDGHLVLRWTEMSGPPVKPPTRRGFGTTVMDHMIRGSLKGKMRFDWRAEGLACEMVLPM